MTYVKRNISLEQCLSNISANSFLKPDLIESLFFFHCRSDSFCLVLCFDCFFFCFFLSFWLQTPQIHTYVLVNRPSFCGAQKSKQRKEREKMSTKKQFRWLCEEERITDSLCARMWVLRINEPLFQMKKKTINKLPKT